ncbi:SufB/SufD family protein [Rhabdochlamydiaceae symbiont of Dictyostelium giganteum]|uniref:SufB/SufD family protein n=1 Tax=Rhabdochlamydiaceae symbiont of Dictyostelium giganteum TaxID=3342349 RepID=UPI00384DA525
MSISDFSISGFAGFLETVHKERPLQKKAWESFKQKGLPHKKLENFHYFPFKKLYEKSLVLGQGIPSQEEVLDHVMPEAKESYLVFVNGSFIPERSCIPSALEVLSLEEGLKQYGFFLQGRITKWIKEEKDPFALLNFALYQEGVFIYLPPKMQLNAPLQCLHYSTSKDHYHPSTVYFFGSLESRASVVSTVVGEGVYHPVIDVSLEERALFSYTESSRKGKGILLSDVRASIKSCAEFNYFNITASDVIARHHLNISLMGEGAKTDLQGVWNLTNHSQCHISVDMKHLEPHTFSHQRFKGVLRGSSQSSFEGKIHVDQKAQKTEAYQVNHNLLLNEGAIANARPNLTIFADDVKASHGATVAELDEEHLFYLQSRGLSLSCAKELLVKSFIQEVLNQIPFPSLFHDFFV